jgi:hypothetical protein
VTSVDWVLRLKRQHDRLVAETLKMVETVAAARAAGCSWSMIGEAFGTTKQGAHTRWKPRLDRMEAT